MGFLAQADRAFPSVDNRGELRILVVDDSRAQRRILTLMLARWGFDVAEAENAEEGLALCRDFDPDLVISDWMMPGMTGIEFCRAFRALKRDRYGYFILLTSKSEKAAVASGLQSGADDFLTKPVNGEELRARIGAGARILTMERELKTKNEVIAETLAELKTAHTLIDNDLRQARVIQQSLMPKRAMTFGGSRVSVLLKSCGHVGGDLAGMFDAETGGFGLFSLDVSGHGITSALVTARVAGYLSSEYPEENLALDTLGAEVAFVPPALVAERLNGRMVRQQGLSEYLTMAYLQVCPETGLGRLVQAGHPPPLILRRDGATEFVGQGGLPIGLIDGATYDETHVMLNAGDRVLLYSDGFTEAELPNGGLLGEEGLVDLIRAVSNTVTGPDFLDALYETLRTRTERSGDFEDDISAAFLEYGVA